VALFFATLPTYIDKRSQQAVLSALGEALRSDDFLKAFTAQLVKHGSDRTQPPAQTAFTLLEWSCALLLRLDTAAAKKACGKVIELQSALLDVLIADDAKWRPAACVVARLLRQRPALLPEYLEVAGAAPGAGLVGAVLAAARRSPQVLPAAKAQLLPALCDKVLAARERPSPALMSSFSPLLASLSHEEFGGQVAPALVKVLRRTPDVALAALPPLLAAAGLDTSRYVAELLPALLQQLRLKEALRPAVSEALGALAGAASAPEALRALAGGVSRLLDGSAEGKVKSAAERASLAGALGVLAGPPGRSAPSALAGVAAEVAAFAAKYHQEEGGRLGRGRGRGLAPLDATGQHYRCGRVGWACPVLGPRRLPPLSLPLQAPHPAHTHVFPPLPPPPRRSERRGAAGAGGGAGRLAAALRHAPASSGAGAAGDGPGRRQGGAAEVLPARAGRRVEGMPSAAPALGRLRRGADAACRQRHPQGHAARRRSGGAAAGGRHRGGGRQGG
jgi:hypothetical protein